MFGEILESRSRRNSENTVRRYDLNFNASIYIEFISRFIINMVEFELWP